MRIIANITDLHWLRLHLLKHDLKLDNNVIERPLVSFLLISFPLQQRMTFIYNHQTITYRASENQKKLDIYVQHLRQNQCGSRTNENPFNDLSQSRRTAWGQYLQKRFTMLCPIFYIVNFNSQNCSSELCNLFECSIHVCMNTDVYER